MKVNENDKHLPSTEHRIVHDSIAFSSSPPTAYQHDVGNMIWSMTRSTTAAAKPGRAQRLKSEASVESDSSPRPIEEKLKTQKEDNFRQVQQIQKGLSIDENRQLDEECLQRFIKVHVQLMTEDHVSMT